MNTSESTTEKTLPPTLDALNMKREQDRMQDRQIIELLDKRRLLNEAHKQNEADLLFVGYHPPMMAPQPKRYTEEEWAKIHANEGFHLYLKSGIEATYKKLVATEKALAWSKGLHQQMKTKYQELLKKSSSKKK